MVDVPSRISNAVLLCAALGVFYDHLCRLLVYGHLDTVLGYSLCTCTFNLTKTSLLA